MKRIVIGVIALAVALAACGGGSKVGDEGLLDFDEKGTGRLGTVSKSASPSPKATATKKKKAAPRQTKAPEPKANVWEVAITAEGFDPFNFRVFQGDEITVTNKDSQPRSFTADDGTFDSGMLAPGKSWTYTADELGTFNVSDQSRPFVVGKVEVIKRP